MKNFSFRKIFVFVQAATLCLTANTLMAQSPGGNRNWVASPFEDKVFIPNRGQFDHKDRLDNSQIYYGVNNNGTQIYFTPKGLTYRYDLPEFNRENANKGTEKSKEERMMEMITYMAHMEWIGSDPNVKITADDKVKQYYNFQAIVEDNKTLHKIPAYEKLYYTGIYPGVDVEYIFPAKGGIKYSLIVHPGADVSKIKMKYTGQKNISVDASGNLLIGFNKIGSITDHAPVTFYKDDNSPIASSFQLSGNVVTFKLGSYDNTKTIVIDPWTISPGFTTQNKGYDCTKNAAGDIYVFGGSTPYQLRKFDGTNGTLIWSYTASNLGTYYGDLALDVNGNIYLTEGCCSRRICKLDGASLLKWNSSTATNFRELWRLGVSCKTPDIILAGGDPGTGVMKVGKMDTTAGNITQTAVVGNGSEIRSIGIDAAGDIYTMHVTTGGGSGNSGNNATNDLVRATPAFATTWNVSSGYNLDEYAALYVATNNFNGINGIAFHTNCLYTYNGSTVNKRLKSNGNLVTTAVVAGATLNQCSGIAVDGCGNVYVGTMTGVSKLDSNLTFISSLSTSTAVYDLFVGLAGEIVATGNGFLGSYAGLTACASTCGCPVKTFTQNITNVTCPGTSTGAASVTATGGAGTHTYSWSNGQTGQTATGLSAGTYAISVNDSVGCISVQNITINQPAVIAPTITPTNVLCNGNSSGSATVTGTGGTGTLTYSWNTGATGGTATGLSAGTYTLTVTDSLGCSIQQTFNVTQPLALALVDSTINLACNGNTDGTSTAIVNGGAGSYTYSWNNGQTTQTATGLGAGTYTVTATDGNGCTITRQVTVFQPSGMNLNAAGLNVNCTDDTVGWANAIVNGGIQPYTYSWNTGATTQMITGLTAGTYTVLVTDASGCTKLQVVNVNFSTKPKASISATPTSGLIPLSVTFTNGSTGGVSYSWIFGDGNSANTQNATNTYLNGGTYTVMMIVTASNGCKDTAYITIIADGFSAIIVPNVFSPNGDGTNDVFVIDTEGISELTLEIYDRWGLLMSTITSVTGGWDGKAKSGNDAPEGTYYYILKAKGIDSKDYDLKGYLMLLRD